MAIYTCISKWKHPKNHEIKPSRIPQPSPKSQKYLYVKYMVHTVTSCLGFGTFHIMFMTDSRNNWSVYTYMYNVPWIGNTDVYLYPGISLVSEVKLPVFFWALCRKTCQLYNPSVSYIPVQSTLPTCINSNPLGLKKSFNLQKIRLMCSQKQ